MNSSEMKLIEIELAVALPVEYQNFMQREFALGFCGNSDSDLWDCPNSIVERNLELRENDCMMPWPAELLFVGDPLTACGNAIRLTDSECMVYWVDHCDIRNVSTGVPFLPWAESILLNYN